MPATASGHVKYCINYGKILQTKLHTHFLDRPIQSSRTIAIASLARPTRRNTIHAPNRDIRRKMSVMGSPSFPALADNLEKTWMLVPLPTQRSTQEKLDDAFLW